MSIEEVQARFGELHQAVCRDTGRVEVHNGEHCCVLISKAELESLEQALEILSNTSDVQKIARTIAAMGSSAGKAPVLAAGRFGAN
jgi:PHD/YefM family antitoxin component YafN of YafNO toxin-antitoxin module